MFLLRDVQLRDVDAYRGMRCDPAMMADLGGPLPPEQMAGQVERDLALVASGTGMVKMIVTDEAGPESVAGTVTLWAHEVDGEPAGEIGWMVLPEFQGCGIARRAVRMLLDQARGEERWGVVHAFPAVTNGPSNAICRSLGFVLVGERDTPFRGQVFRTHHWTIDLRNGAGR